MCPLNKEKVNSIKRAIKSKSSIVDITQSVSITAVSVASNCAKLTFQKLNFSGWAKTETRLCIAIFWIF